jgi:hypothetical protein
VATDHSGLKKDLEADVRTLLKKRAVVFVALTLPAQRLVITHVLEVIGFWSSRDD